MLSKKECLQALDWFVERKCDDYKCESCDIKGHCDRQSQSIEKRSILEQLIKEHFNPQPYKWRDLKPNLWVWDKKKQRFLKIIERTSDCLGRAIIKYCNGYDNQGIYYFDEFEENRFYPVQMANVGCV